jgi:hypothetical protein
VLVEIGDEQILAEAGTSAIVNGLTSLLFQPPARIAPGLGPSSLALTSTQQVGVGG